jgi:hypothetical protein
MHPCIDYGRQDWHCICSLAMDWLLGEEGCIGRSRILLYVSFVLGGKKGKIIMTTRWNDTI